MMRWRQRWLKVVGGAAALWAVLALGGGAAAPGGPAASACDERNPPLAAVLFQPTDRAASVVRFSDGAANDLSSQVTLATGAQTGQVYGLAYDATRGHLYAAAFHGQHGRYGPAGPGAIYRIDLNSGVTAPWANLPAGPDRRGPGVDWNDTDGETARWVGRTGLADIEIDDAATTLFAMNLTDRRVYRLGLPDGRPLGSFATGGAGAAEAENLRPFGLGFHAGRLYHGVVDSRADAALPGSFTGRVYVSAPDGRGLAEFAAFDLNYRRAPRWRPWSDPWRRLAPLQTDTEPQPILSGLAFRANGTAILGLRDRTADSHFPDAGRGDILATRPLGPTQAEVLTGNEVFQDDTAVPEPAFGALAVFGAVDQLVATAWRPVRSVGGSPDNLGAIWFDVRSGLIRGPLDGIEPLTTVEPHGIGDIELLCGPDRPPPTAPSPTDEPPTATSTATSVTTYTPAPTATPARTATLTLTLVPPTPTATAPPRPTGSPTAPAAGPIYLPVAEKAVCRSESLDIVLALDASTTMLRPAGDGHSRLDAAVAAADGFLGWLGLGAGDGGTRARAAVVAFNARAWTEAPLSTDAVALRAALARLPSRVAEGTRLDLGLEEAAWALAPAAEPGKRALLLLSDGLANGVPPAGDGRGTTTVLAAAERIKAAGVAVYTIGFGPTTDVDHALLRAVASVPASYRHAPGAPELPAAFDAIARELRCRP